MMSQKDMHTATLSETEFRALLSAVDLVALVSITDEKGTIVYANKKFVEISKYSFAELNGQNHRILKSGQQPDTLFVDLWNTISSGRVWRGEIKNKAKDGTYYWVDTCIAPIMDESGKPERYISIRFPIDEKKSLEERTAEQLRNLQKTNELMVGRELKMAEMKKQIQELEERLVRLAGEKKGNP